MYAELNRCFSTFAEIVASYFKTVNETTAGSQNISIQQNLSAKNKTNEIQLLTKFSSDCFVRSIWFRGKML